MCCSQRVTSRCSSGVNEASMATPPASDFPSVRSDHQIMLHRRKRVVEMVQQPSPLLVTGGPAEPDLVALDGVPPHEKQEAVVVLDAVPQLVSAVAPHRSDDRLGAREGLPECFGLTSPDVQDRHLEDRMFTLRAGHGTVLMGERPTMSRTITPGV